MIDKIKNSIWKNSSLSNNVLIRIRENVNYFYNKLFIESKR